MNSVILIGRLTEDPELKTTTSGKSVVSTSIAVDRIGEGTDFINIVAWEKTAEFLKNYFRKGAKIAIEGRLTSRSYEDRDGKKRTAYEVIIHHAEFCEKREAANEANTSEPVYQEVPEEDLPF